MANPEHLKILAQGIPKWNEWREEKTHLEPDLSGAILEKADLREANLSEADLRGTILLKADLEDAILHEAILRGADLREAAWRARSLP